ncbi:helix-turn-helix domain-containing protein [Mucilaginibacter paludis]|uniref:Transcriptional regulator with PAS/PAC sensors, AraC family n=1 Tax=Mucilaginibacter paludis DSM 18603 TaxID=714943 RepID=H1YGE4_9SPHI|nr:helix-turn-helix domain-containing protein [Mucilaginibacter paludis]EHQ24496.1 transcriptional regulator with PAS/PAC sensors, AraC family [Mucilaginibacter paludis DSM 18603]
MNSSLNKKFDLEYFFELSPDLLCIAGYDGYFKKINPAVSKTLGYTNKELFAKPINSFVYAEDRDITARKRERLKQDAPLLNFENRYVTKSGDIVWLSWTSMPIKREKVVFAIAKNITSKKKAEEFNRASFLLGNSAQQNALKQHAGILNFDDIFVAGNSQTIPKNSQADVAWFSELERIIRKYTGKINFGISLLCTEMAISERQLYRRIKNAIGITPNQYIRIIRLQMAREAIASGKYRTIAEIAYAVGFETPTYFSKLFKEVYGFDVGDLL